MYSYMKEMAYEANMELNRQGLILYTFGNASCINREQGLIAIKPSGVSYEQLKIEDIVIVDLENKVVDGHLKPSSDTRTHTYLYKNFPNIGGITHTHSTYATAWAQACKSIPCYGTTHADYVYGDIPCTHLMRNDQVEKDYEEETGKQIIEAMSGKNPKEIPMTLVGGHGPFTWGKDASEAVYHAVILEQIAKMASLTCSLNSDISKLQASIVDKHYQRKHGVDSYYGQNKVLRPINAK